MKVRLMYSEQDFDLQADPIRHEDDLIHDLDLATLFAVMAQRDEFISTVAQRALLTSLTDLEAIVYRQDVLRDCLANPETVRELYDLAGEALAAERNVWGFSSTAPDSVLRRAVQVLELLLEHIKRLRKIADEHADTFDSEGFRRFFAMIASELDDAYLQEIEGHLQRLHFNRGTLMSAQLTSGNKGDQYVLRRPNGREPGLKAWLASLARHSGFTFQIPSRDEAGMRALARLRDRGVNHVANAAAQSADHISSFFAVLRIELGFYVGALNLKEQLDGKQEPCSFPDAAGAGRRVFDARGLYDVGLSLRVQGRVVANDVDADGKSLVMITGANQGGKSTFLRSIGQAQLMMQAGMFVGAESFSAEVCHGLFTHFKREEDATMTSGKFDEELARVSAIADNLTPNGLVLCNESFAATNEREGSEVALQITRALLDSGVKVFFVTHMYDLARRAFGDEQERALFLRADRRSDGERTFKLVVAPPLTTSFGADVYRRIFTDHEDDEEGTLGSAAEIAALPSSPRG